MMLLRGLVLDMRMGWRDLPIPLIGLVVAALLGLIDAYSRAGIYSWDTASFTFADNFGLVFGGSWPFEFRTGVMFVPPLGWTFVLALLLYLTLSYPYRDVMGIGQQVLIRERSRGLWWLSKCLWVLLVTLCGLAVVALTALLWTVAHGQDIALAVHQTACMLVGTPYDNLAGEQVGSGAFFVCVAVMACGLALVQLALSLAVRPSVAFLLLMGILIASAYAQHVLLPGNYLMLARWSGMASGGVDACVGMCFGAGAGIAGCALGGWHFNRMDLVDKELSA